MLKIDPERGDLAREFRARPFGPHSAELQKVLNVMRWEDNEGKHVIVNTVPHEQWRIARLPARRGVELDFCDEAPFTDLAAAFWHVFRLRWKRHTGRWLPDD